MTQVNLTKPYASVCFGRKLRHDQHIGALLPGILLARMPGTSCQSPGVPVVQESFRVGRRVVDGIGAEEFSRTPNSGLKSEV